ncbi:hypothetical protein TIFTF001_033654 [Ficus carica]|uniref:Uncharacterized protein n=1 Tax=Ficus carica TaxID=3494 RepID=A0AA88DZ66_FICCA|nr:hypothetical protein TIFTF001_033654 [Ficus carica]
MNLSMKTASSGKTGQFSGKPGFEALRGRIWKNVKHESCREGFFLVEGSLLLCPDLEQNSIGHSGRGNYNSAYSIGFCCVTCLIVLAERKLTSYVYAVGGSLQSWYQSGFLLSDFTVCLPSPPSLYDDMDPDRVDEDQDAVTSFYESHPLLFDGTRRTVSLAAWLYDMELIFRTCHIEARLQVSLASRCLVADARLWWMALTDWHAYPHESMSHYCRRFQEAMLPHIPQDIDSPGM